MKEDAKPMEQEKIKKIMFHILEHHWDTEDDPFHIIHEAFDDLLFDKKFLSEEQLQIFEDLFKREFPEEVDNFEEVKTRTINYLLNANED